MKIHRIQKTSHRPSRAPDRRKSACRRGYGRHWENYTARRLQKSDDGSRVFCIACIHTLEFAVLVDHIIPVNQLANNQPTGSADPVFWPAWNHQPLCRRHHQQKSMMHDDWYRANRPALLRKVEDMLVTGESEIAIRNMLILSNNIWPDGFFQEPDP